MQNWIEILTAYQVAKLGTVSAAASALGIHRITVSRHIDALEADLGRKLFLRHGRGYTLTERGQEFLSVISQVDQMISDFAGRSKAQSAELSGELILTASPALTYLFMRPSIALRVKHPKIRINILSQDELLKLEYGEAHIALVVDRKPDNPDYVVTPFRVLNMGLYAHQSYIERMGMPQSIEDFKQHDFVCNQDRFACSDFEKWLLDIVPADRFVFSTSHPGATQQAIISGAAIGFLPQYYANTRGNMEQIVAIDKTWLLPTWLVSHVDLHRTEKVQAMLKAIQEEFQAVS